MFNETAFQLHKLHSNKLELEKEDSRPKEEEQSFAKQHLEVSGSDTKLLGLGWNKDTASIYINTRLKRVKRSRRKETF